MKTILNLMEQVVIEEAEKLIQSYPHHPYQKAFALPDLRQKLVAYVLNRVRNFYVVLNECDLNKVNCQSVCRSLVDQGKLESTIHIGIREVFEQSQVQSTSHTSKQDHKHNSPSDWFG
ncbi:late competence development ComFB family protein [Almyronema epifaneia]|uniref:Late competence development ComFB family protein n=1 Tax=Almyronema epifaneia S1 TaxID=2991925 RepID=A0ABW6IBU2_9CYAN